MKILTHKKEFLVVPRFEEIPFIIHGFGTKYLMEEHFKEKTELRDFKFLSLIQIHSDIIRVIEKFPDKKLEGDAMLTKCPGIFLIIKTADCLPIFIVDELNKVIASVHCGWKSTCKRILKKVIQKMEACYGSTASSLLAAMGPCIGRECYEVGEDVLKRFENECLPTKVFLNSPVGNGKYLMDLKEANYCQMIELGVKKKNIFSVDLCTHCEKYLLSYRRDDNLEGRMLNFIGISF